MISRSVRILAAALGFLSTCTNASPTDFKQLIHRGLPADATGVKTIKSNTGATIRYKEPGKAGVCETTPGVNSYSGYVDLSPDAHTFFWFFEARKDPGNKPLTLWLNGGPGSDSLIGLFQELGPCNVTEDLETQLNPYSWTEESNMLFLSQPVGTGFSYGQAVEGSLNPYTGEVENATFGGIDGRYPIEDPTILDTTDLAAVATWHVLQAFLGALPQLDGEVDSKSFNLWTESYGGHYGPSFFNYFYEQNQMIGNGTVGGTKLEFNTLGLINAIVDEYIQAPYYPEFAVHNTYGIKAVNDSVYEYMKFATYAEGFGCLTLIDQCRQVNRSTTVGQLICQQATDQCRNNVETPYYVFSGRGVYDIRHPYDDPTPPEYFNDYLNKAEVQNALGVNLNYTQSNSDIYYAFANTGDFVYPTFITDLEMILNNSVRVAMFYGDADFICNWFGGEAVSNALQYTHTADFAKTGYAPFLVDGTEYGEVRQYGNFSFARIYEAGHEVPYYQPEASLAFFKRTLEGLDIATGKEKVSADLGTEGEASATHTEPFVALPNTTAPPTGSQTGEVGGATATVSASTTGYVHFP